METIYVPTPHFAINKKGVVFEYKIWRKRKMQNNSTYQEVVL